MKTSDERSPVDVVEPSAWVRRIGLVALIVSIIPIIVLVPLVFNPAAATSHTVETGWTYVELTEVFYPTKFLVLMVLSAVLLVAVLCAVLADTGPLEVPLLVPALTFFCIAALSTIFSETPMTSLIGERYVGLLYLGAALLLFYATSRFVDSWARVRALLVAGVATAVLISIYGIAQQFGLDPVPDVWGVPWAGGERAFSTVQHPVHLAAYLTLMIGATLALYFLAERRWEQALWLAALAILGACWLYTYARGAVVGVGLTLPVVLFLAQRRLGSVRPLLVPLAVLAVAVLAADLLSPQSVGMVDRFANTGFFHTYGWVIALGVGVVLAVFVLLWLARRLGGARPLLVPLAVLAVAVLAAIYYLAGSQLTDVANRLEGANSFALDPAELALQGRGEDLSVAMRLLVWRDTIPVILERPLLGHGPDNFTGPFYRHAGAEIRTQAQETRSYFDNAHNEFLQVAATTGLLGLTAYLWIFVSYFRSAYRSGGWVLLGLSGGVLAYILQLQTAFTTISTGVTFWAILGVSVAVMRIQNRSSEESRVSDSSMGSATG